MDDEVNGYVEPVDGGPESPLLDTLRRAFREFLGLPTLLIVGFLLLAAGSYALDAGEFAWLEPVRELLQARIFADARGTSSLLGVVAGGIMTVTSITISILLLALQQSAAAMTTQVFDQFLRRSVNQVYFGYFIGLVLFALVTLGTVSEGFVPLLGASLTLLLTVVGLYLLILLLYTTINQMRPDVIIEAIRDHVMSARESERRLLAATIREPQFEGEVNLPVLLSRHGYMTHLDLAIVGRAMKEASGQVEIEMLVTIGSFVAFGDVVAEVKAESNAAALAVAEVVARAIHLEAVRDIDADPAYGIQQLETIAWTSISTAHSNPLPGLLTVYSLRDVMARWAGHSEPPSGETPLPVVYPDDTFTNLLHAFESIAVVSSESMQHQPFTEVVRTFSKLFGRLPPEVQTRSEDVILRLLPALGDHVLTGELETALDGLTGALQAAGRVDASAKVNIALEALRGSVGRLGSRATRAE